MADFNFKESFFPYIGEEIKAFLKRIGFEFHYSPETEGKVNTVLVASKTSMTSTLFPQLGIHVHRIIKVTTEEYALYACYFPQQDEKKHLFEFLLSEFASQPDQPLIITGDINTGKHTIDEEGSTFYHADYLNKFEVAGMIDAFRDRNPLSREYSWYTNRGNGFRIDHFFISAHYKDKIYMCYYEQQARTRGISDHAMMVLRLR